MIMPCMNAISAADRGGSTPFVEAGSRLVGSPGAPGCTTTGAEDSFCCAAAGGGKQPAPVIAATNTPVSTAQLWQHMRLSTMKFPIWGTALPFKVLSHERT